jgi:soluble lytic murein transglycosylase
MFPLHALIRLLALVLLPIGATFASSADDPFKEARRAFERAYAQVEKGEPQRPDSEELRTYPLYPYLQAARVQRALAGASGELGPADERAETFITYYDREPVGKSLRRTWLASLAKRKQWAKFLEHYRAEEADDALECHSFTARIELGRVEGLEREIAEQWLTPRSVPDCREAFEWLRARNQLTPALIEQRVRLALGERNLGFARQIARQLPPDRQKPFLQWADLLERPRREIDELIAAPEKPVMDEALLAGWTWLARRDPDDALVRYEKLVRTRRLTPEQASRCALELAFALAWDRRPEALHYFSKVLPAHLDDYALEWQARAALWAGDWPLVSRSIAAMSGEQRSQARWRYWAARAAEQTGDAELARSLYESVLIDDNFYSVMAAARLGQPLAPHPQPIVRNTTELAQIGQLPPVVRARELFLLGWRSLANSEWVYAIDTLPEPARAQAVHLAAEWGWHYQVIATAARLSLFNDYPLLYPTPFDREVRAASKLARVPPELIYSVMRQESLYQADAVSPAGARGLLQLLPETARRTARAWKRRRPSVDDLYEPKVNVPLGAALLRTLIDRFQGQTIVALAAYNAGPNAAARWLPGRALESDIWIENIPYNETRSYVQRILWHNLVFNWLQEGKPQRTDVWLAHIAPPDAETSLGANF